VAVSILDDALNPTGQVFNTQTKNDLGEFDIAFVTSGPVALEGKGTTTTRSLGQLSSSELTLRALYIPSAPGAQSAFVNMSHAPDGGPRTRPHHLGDWLCRGGDASRE